MAIRVQEEGFDIGAEIKALTLGRTGIGLGASFIGLVRDFGDPGAGPESTAVRCMTLAH